MKSKNLILSAMLMALPSTLMAQQNILQMILQMPQQMILQAKAEN